MTQKEIFFLLASLAEADLSLQNQTGLLVYYWNIPSSDYKKVSPSLTQRAMESIDTSHMDVCSKAQGNEGLTVH